MSSNSTLRRRISVQTASTAGRLAWVTWPNCEPSETVPVGVEELGVVEDVEELGHGNRCACLRDRESLQHGKIGIADAAVRSRLCGGYCRSFPAEQGRSIRILHRRCKAAAVLSVAFSVKLLGSKK